MHETRATLLFRLKADGAERDIAWAEFCDLYEPVIAGFARRSGVPPSDLPDLVQQVVLGFFSVQPRFVYSPERGRFRSYLKTCVLHELQRLRTKAAAAARHAASTPLPEQAEEALWDREWEARQLERALERLRDQYRENATYQAFERVVVHGQSPDAVATELGLSRDSVYQARSRLLARLRLELASVAEQMGE